MEKIKEAVGDIIEKPKHKIAEAMIDKVVSMLENIDPIAEFVDMLTPFEAEITIKDKKFKVKSFRKEGHGLWIQIKRV